MFDIGFLELLVIGVVLLLVMGPERLPEVAKQAAFMIRKARQGLFRLRSEMQDEIQGTPFADLEDAKREIADLKNDLRQFGRDLAESADSTEYDSESARNAASSQSDQELTEQELIDQELSRASEQQSSVDASPQQTKA